MLGRLGGDRRSEKAKHHGGTGSAYTLARLKRDRPYRRSEKVKDPYCAGHCHPG